MLSSGDIERILERIARGYAPVVLGIFGSYAIGRAHEASDLDILVIKETAEVPRRRKRTVERLLFGLLHPVDVQVFTPAEFEDVAYDEWSFGWVIAQQVRVSHASAEAARRVPSLAGRLVGLSHGDCAGRPPP